MKRWRFLCVLILVSLLTGCAGRDGNAPPTPIPAAQLPTVIALTLEASGVTVAAPGSPTLSLAARTAAPKTSTPTATEAPPTRTPTRKATRTATRTASPTATKTSSPTPTYTPTLTPVPYTATPTIDLTAEILKLTPSSTPTETPFPVIPDARVQIFKIGEMSLLTSPIPVTARLYSRTGKVARVELWGEDGRLLARQVRVFHTVPWHVASLSHLLEFEISAAGELGRLVVSVEDIYGRLVDLNSVNVVLLSSGQTELNPATALWEVIVIQEPQPKALIQGGLVFVHGIARPNDPDFPLHLMLVAEDGRVLGERLASVTMTVPGGYGLFSADVPYTVSEVTPALLTVYESGGLISDIAHLTSMEVLLSP